MRGEVWEVWEVMGNKEGDITGNKGMKRGVN